MLSTIRLDLRPFKRMDMQQRIHGLDVARALAIMGMVIVNFTIVITTKTDHSLFINSTLITITSLLEGRASALFVILAGMGISLLSNKARESNNPLLVSQSRISLTKRGLLLIAIGLLYIPIWEADILHFYGVYFLIAAAIVSFNDKALLLTSVFIMLVFPILLLLFDYEQHWDWSTLTYHHFWSLDGMIRHTLFNGFHPVFPWAAFLVFGMWLGRQDLSQCFIKQKAIKQKAMKQKAIKQKLLIGACFTLVLTEGTFYFIRAILGDGSALGISPEDVSLLFSTSIIPPLPQYIISAASSALIVIIGCLYFAERCANSRINQWLSQTGQLSLTLYIAHVIIGMGILESIGRLENQSIYFSLFSALVFCGGGVVFSVVWLKFFKMGPLEWVFRKVVG